MREVIHNEYYVAYNVIGFSDSGGYFVCKPTKLRGKALVKWLYHLAAAHENKQWERGKQKAVSTRNILIITIDEVASWVVKEK